MPSNCPKWLDTAVFYIVYPQSFYDSNGDGIGDLQGLIAKLDHIERLGCNAIWMTPCYRSPFRDAGYDIADYYEVDPRYGANADLRRLFKEAGRRGIRICLDLVLGHTSIGHPWFQASAQAGKNRHTNWYIWTDSWLSFSSANGLRLVSGFSERDGCFAVNFFQSQPALNHGFAQPADRQDWQLPPSHPEVKALRGEVKKIIRFWLDMGASGFRADMAASLVKSDPDHKATSAFWREIRSMLDREYPEAVLISEWGNPPKAINAGFHVDFMSIHEDPGETSLFRAEKTRNILPGVLDFVGKSFFDKSGRGDISVFLDSYEKFYRKTKRAGYVSIPTGNHDLGRLSMGRTQRELEVIFAFLLTMPGIPMIYYGEEIGMQYRHGLASKEGGYSRTGSRTPMQWSSGKNAGFSTSAKGSLYLPVSTGKQFPNVENQERRPASLMNRIRRIIALRRERLALCADGDFEVVYAKAKKYPFVYLRRRGRQQILVVLNPSKKPVEVQLPALSGARDPAQWLMGRGANLSGSGPYHLEMQGISYGIFEL